MGFAIKGPASVVDTMSKPDGVKCPQGVTRDRRSSEMVRIAYMLCSEGFGVSSPKVLLDEQSTITIVKIQVDHTIINKAKTAQNFKSMTGNIYVLHQL